MAGYVGAGMLAAAVCGEVFASPSEDAVLAAIRAVTGPAGVHPALFCRQHAAPSASASPAQPSPAQQLSPVLP